MDTENTPTATTEAAIAGELTPAQIVAALDRYIVGQNEAKRAVAIALRNRYRRRLVEAPLRDEILPKNILMVGPTGVGKTEIARRLATLANAPFVKVEATKYTEVGYVGRDVESMVRDLVETAVRMVQDEHLVRVRARARDIAEDRVLEILQPGPRKPKGHAPLQVLLERMSPLHTQEEPPPAETPAETSEEEERVARIRERLRAKLREGALDDREVEVTIEETGRPFMEVLSSQAGFEEVSFPNLGEMLGPMMPPKKKKRKVSIREAIDLLAEQEAQNLLDMDEIRRLARERAEQSGIIFIDEIDKVAGGRGGGSQGPDVSREGVQRDILPIVEGSTVQTKHGPVQTDHVLFIAAGAFHISKPSDLIPELQGRLPIRVELTPLTEADFVRILTEPENALTKQCEALLATENVTLKFTEDGLREVARIAQQVNERNEDIGARRLHTVMERVLEEISFAAPERPGDEVIVDSAYVLERLQDIVRDDDLTRYIL
jgi:ATP-dependent HslUV protease ATP-binding subunit HslU